jgi:RNA polymerase sigma-70 factor (ECF subfamily)
MMPNATTQLDSLTRIINQLQSEDDAARAQLIEHACGRLRGLVRRHLNSFPAVRRWEETGDVLQSVLMRLHRALENCRPADTREFFALSGSLIRRELIDLKRHYYGPEGIGANHVTQVRRNGESTLPVHEPSAGGSHDPVATAQWLELHAKVNELPEELVEVVNLVWYQGLTHDEAAQVLETSTKTIQRRWRDARIQLGRWLMQ